MTADKALKNYLELKKLNVEQIKMLLNLDLIRPEVIETFKKLLNESEKKECRCKNLGNFVCDEWLLSPDGKCVLCGHKYNLVKFRGMWCSKCKKCNSAEYNGICVSCSNGISSKKVNDSLCRHYSDAVIIYDREIGRCIYCNEQVVIR